MKVFIQEVDREIYMGHGDVEGEMSGDEMCVVIDTDKVNDFVIHKPNIKIQSNELMIVGFREHKRSGGDIVRCEVLVTMNKREA